MYEHFYLFCVSEQFFKEPSLYFIYVPVLAFYMTYGYSLKGLFKLTKTIINKGISRTSESDDIVESTHL